VQIAFDKTNEAAALLSVDVSPADYQESFKKKIKEYSQKANLKGFRPGKVPPIVIEKMYGKGIKADVLNDVVFGEVEKYLQDNEINILGQLLLNSHPANQDENWLDREEFTYKFDLALRPNVEVPSVDKVTITWPEISVEESRVEKYILDQRKQMGKPVDNATQVEEGDTVFGQLKQEGKEDMKVAIPVKKILGAAAKLFIGLETGATTKPFDIQLAFEPNDLKIITGLKAEESAELKGDYTFTLENISRTELAPLDQELFDRLLGKDAAKSEEEFMDKVRAMFADVYHGESAQYFQLALRNHLLKTTKIDLSEELLRKQFDLRIEGQHSKEDLDKSFGYYLEDTKWGLITDAIFKANAWKVEEADIEDTTRRHLVKEYSNYGLGSLPAEVMNNFIQRYLSEDKGKNVNAMIAKTIDEKVTAYFRQNCKLIHKSVTIDEFEELVKQELNG
jgi:trigger factor